MLVGTSIAAILGPIVVWYFTKKEKTKKRKIDVSVMYIDEALVVIESENDIDTLQFWYWKENRGKSRERVIRELEKKIEIIEGMDNSSGE